MSEDLNRDKFWRSESGSLEEDGGILDASTRSEATEDYSFIDDVLESHAGGVLDVGRKGFEGVNGEHVRLNPRAYSGKTEGARKVRKANPYSSVDIDNVIDSEGLENPIMVLYGSALNEVLSYNETDVSVLTRETKTTEEEPDWEIAENQWWEEQPVRTSDYGEDIVSEYARQLTESRTQKLLFSARVDPGLEMGEEGYDSEVISEELYEQLVDELELRGWRLEQATADGDRRGFYMTKSQLQPSKDAEDIQDYLQSK